MPKTNQRYRQLGLMLVLIGLMALGISACGNGQTATLPEDEVATAVQGTKQALAPPPTHTATAAPPSPTPTSTEAPQIVLDFVESACNAEWSNNGEAIPCPGDDLYQIGAGYVGTAVSVILEGGVEATGPSLITHPAAKEGFFGIFGAYPLLTVQAGDRFQAEVGCLNDLYGAELPTCEVEISLEYFDAAGNYHSNLETGWVWTEKQDGATTKLNVDLSSLAEQMVRFLLVVRDGGDPLGDYVVWFQPQIVRGTE